ncbi:hypothetical protein ACS3SW_07625 [Roseobacteraceae bacterium S113]
MNDTLNLKIFIGLVIGFFALAVFLIGLLGFQDLSTVTGFLRAYSTALTATTAIVAIFFGVGGKYLGFRVGWFWCRT